MRGLPRRVLGCVTAADACVPTARACCPAATSIDFWRVSGRELAKPTSDLLPGILWFYRLACVSLNCLNAMWCALSACRASACKQPPCLQTCRATSRLCVPHGCWVALPSCTLAPRCITGRAVFHQHRRMHRSARFYKMAKGAAKILLGKKSAKDVSGDTRVAAEPSCEPLEPTHLAEPVLAKKVS